MKPPTNWKICQHNRHKTDCIECCMVCLLRVSIFSLSLSPSLPSPPPRAPRPTPLPPFPAH